MTVNRPPSGVRILRNSVRLSCVILSAIFVLFTQTPLSAQKPDCTHRMVFVSVLDREGNAVPGVTAADFRATVDNKPANIVSAVRDAQPRRIVVVLDASGSM